MQLHAICMQGFSAISPVLPGDAGISGGAGIPGDAIFPSEVCLVFQVVAMENT